MIERQTGDIVLFIGDDLESLCRICHEESFDGLESPCACSGTTKFAHRDCIQRWCDEKGNTTCEICLQEYRPGYTAALKKSQLIDTAVTIRDSLEISRREAIFGEVEEGVTEECTSAAQIGASCCRTLTLVLMAFLLIKHLFTLFTGGTQYQYYPFSLLTMVIMKVSGILFPSLVLVRVISAIRKSILQNYHDTDDENSTSDEDEEDY